MFASVHMSETGPLFVAAVPLRRLPDSVVTPQVVFEILGETVSHPESSPEEH